MQNPFLSFRTYNTLEQAQPLIDLLDINNIGYLVEDETLNYDPTSLNGTSLQKTIVVKIKPSDFISTENLLGEMASKTLDMVDKDHYLFNFTDSELLEILIKPDEWSPFDYELSKKILKDRGKEISPEELEEYKSDRINNLRKEEPYQHILVYIGYTLSLLGGIGGGFIGWHLMSSQKKLPDGNLVYGYNPEDRAHGKIIFIIGIISTLTWLYFRFQLEMQLFIK
jgi:hypothetical protein